MLFKITIYGDVMTEEFFTKGNLTTFLTWFYILISPILVKYGIEIDQTAFIGVAVPLVGLAIAIWSSKNPNNLGFLGNSDTSYEFDDGEDNA